MANGKFISYIRVSTKKQGISGLGLEAQQAAIAQYLNGGNWQLVDQYVEIESGRKNERIKLNEALLACKKNKATLIIAKLDRLSRNSYFVNQLLNSKIDFVACDNPFASKLTIQILAAVAEHEVEMISKRIKEALEQAKNRGVSLGNPDMKRISTLGIEKIKANADNFAIRHQEDFQRLRDSGFTLQQIANKYNSNEVRTARGGNWNPAQVSRILKR